MFQRCFNGEKKSSLDGEKKGILTVFHKMFYMCFNGEKKGCLHGHKKMFQQCSNGEEKSCLDGEKVVSTVFNGEKKKFEW